MTGGELVAVPIFSLSHDLYRGLLRGGLAGDFRDLAAVWQAKRGGNGDVPPDG